MKKNWINTYLLILIISLSGCNENTEHNNKHGHAHDEEAQQILVIDQDYELFAELQPHGDIFEITAHITLLEDYSPMDLENPQWIIMDNDHQLVAKTALHKKQSGIYQGNIKRMDGHNFFHVFEWMHQGKSIRLTDHHHNHHHDENHAHTSHQHTEEGITFLKEQAWKTDFGITKVSEQPFSNIVKTSGRVVTTPEQEEIVDALIDGDVHLDGIRLIEGQFVRKGDKIITIESNENTLENRNVLIRKAQRTYEKEKKEFERAEKLYQDRIISNKAFLARQLAFENARENYHTLSEGYIDGGKPIFAPFSGYITKVSVLNGQHIKAGQPIITILHGNQLQLEIDYPQNQIPKIDALSGLKFHTPTTADWMTVEPVQNMYLSRKIEAGQAFTTLRADLPHHPNLTIGSYAEVILKYKSDEQKLVIPKESLLESEGSYYVFIMTEGENFTKCPVQIGYSDGENVVIKKGLHAGDIVVNKGAYQIKMASLSGKMPTHSHSH